ncbi:MAG: hypothetical protein ACI9MC_000857 [Kiritimatiellia bacterium]
MRGWQICVVLLLVGCGKKVVKSEGFAGEVLTATTLTLQGKVGSLGPPSCGVLTPSRRSIKLVDDDFYLELLEELNSGKPRAVAVEVQGQRFTNDKAGTSTELVVNNIGGRIIGALNADLVHETVGTFIEREDGQKVPAPMNRMSVRVNFNLQPCP